MEADSDNRVRKMDIDNVHSFVRTHKDPVVTAPEVAEHFGVTAKAARYRLKQLEEDGRLCGKTIGASATAWYPVG